MLRPSLVFLGFVLGIGLGLLYGWVISPVKYTDTGPDSFRADYKEQYLTLIAIAYKTDGDLDHAKVRLSKLKDSNPIQSITALAQRFAAEGKAEASDLAVLAADLNDSGTGQTPTQPVLVESPTAPPELPTDVPTVTVSVPLATSVPTPSPTPDFDYTLVSREPYCNDGLRQPLIIVDVVDLDNQPLPGVHITVRWADGQDGFVTGLKPEISSSYGDYLMSPGVTYSLQIGARTPAVTGLVPPTCTATEDNSSYSGAVRIVFQRK